MMAAFVTCRVIPTSVVATLRIAGGLQSNQACRRRQRFLGIAEHWEHLAAELEAARAFLEALKEVIPIEPSDLSAATKSPASGGAE